MDGQTVINQAWAAINSLGGRADQDNSYDQGYVDAIGRALEEIEKLGGRDPLERLAPAVPPSHADSAKAERERCIQTVMDVDNELGRA